MTRLGAAMMLNSLRVLSSTYGQVGIKCKILFEETAGAVQVSPEIWVSLQHGDGVDPERGAWVLDVFRENLSRCKELSQLVEESSLEQLAGMSVEVLEEIVSRARIDPDDLQTPDVCALILVYGGRSEK